MKTSSIRSLLWAAVPSAVVLSSGALTLAQPLQPSTSIPLFMLMVVVVAWQGGFRASIAVAACATLGLDFFFTEPRFTLRMTSPQDIFSLAAFASVSILICHLSQQIRAQSEGLRRAESEQRALYELSRSVLRLDWKESVGVQMCNLIQDRLRLSGVALWDDRERSLAIAGEVPNAIDRLQATFRAGRSYDLPNHAESARILRSGVRPVGAILLRGDAAPLMADSIATLVATHIERTRAMKAEIFAESQAVSERMRTTVLDGLAHAVKTPLTTIVVSSSGLREIGSLTPLQEELAQVIESQAAYLSEVTSKLLRTAKLDAVDMLVMKRPTNPNALLQRVIDELRGVLDVSRVNITGPVQADCLDTDPDLLQMALVQVIENALKYSPEDSAISVRATCINDSMNLAIHNDGSYISPAETHLIFERYYRSASMEHRASGTGIGLSVAKHAIEALGGKIWVESGRQTGTTFTIAVPRLGGTGCTKDPY